jgi:phenylacetate-coenzyme A ligase PaaK-like adenylate-forming protein
MRYADLQARHAAAVMARMPEHLERLDWPRSRIAAERTRALRELVAKAKAASPWHARRLAHLDPGRLTEADLARVPPMTKEDLMANWDAIVTDPRLSLRLVERTLAGMTADTYLFDEFHACASGGSSGRRGVFVYDWRGWALAYLGTARHRVRYLQRNPAPADGRTRSAFVGSAHASHISVIFRTFTPAVRGESRSIDVGLPLEAMVEELNAFQPTSLGGYSSAIGILAHEALRGRLRIAPHVVAGGSEPVTPGIRELVRQAWQRDIVDVWGTSECGFMACSGGADDRLVLNDDLAIVEPVDARGQPAPAGVASAKVLATNLINHALPLIRYEIDDEITLLEEPDPFGSGHRLLAGVLGRADPAFRWASGVSVHPNVIRSPLSREPRALEYQVRQTERGVAVQLRASERFDTRALCGAIHDGLQRAGLADAGVALEFVDQLERTAAGKVRRFICL